MSQSTDRQNALYAEAKARTAEAVAMWREYEERVHSDEREACARVVESLENDWHNSEEAAVVEIFRERFVAAIRARGSK